MPILVKDFTWTQSQNTVHVRIPLRKTLREKVDLFTTDSYIKASFNPFLFEAFLLHDVDNDKSKCLVNDNLITIDLVKRKEDEWETLEKNLTKAEKMKVKQDILVKCQEKARLEAEEKEIKKSQMERFTVQQAMEIDNKQHSIMDARKEEQRKKAMSDLEEWRVLNEKKQKENKTFVYKTSRSNVEITELASDVEGSDSTNNENDVECDKITKIINDICINNKNRKASESIITKPKISPLRKPIKTPVKSEYVDKKKEELAKRVIPKTRQTRDLEITHTPRTFPTPSRESTCAEEEAWLKNITLARRATGFVSEDLRPEEQDPQWCKVKGDELFRTGNYLGAISAYSHGITLSDKLPSLYSNRAAAHFALGNFYKCVSDCSSALELLKPACESNRQSRGKCIARRACALARIGHLSKAINEMKAAAKVLPDDEKIQRDIYDMERAWEQNPDSD